MIHSNGTIRVPEFEIPLSNYLSDTAKAVFTETLLNAPPPIGGAELDINESRAHFDTYLMSPLLEKAKARYPVEIEEQEIGGVRVYVVDPGTRHHDYLLINLHGGAFSYGSGMGQLIESIPIACTAGVPVISIDYRQGPEHLFPAASEDVAAVYRELIKTHRQQNIGLYGCSAGGNLTAMSIAWFDKENLPMPGAIGIVCAGADAAWGGESRYTCLPLTGQQAPAASPNPPPFPMAYLQEADLMNPLVSPIVAPDLLSRFPDTVLISGTRAYDLSAAVHTHTQLIKAGVDARLHVWEGMWHGFLYDVDLPEAREAYAVLADFFHRSWQRLT